MENENGFVFNQTTADANVIKKVKIEWIAGRINIVKGEGDQIQFSESSSARLTEKTAMVSKVAGNELIIFFKKDKMPLFFKGLKKTLTVSLPRDLEVLFVKSISGGIFVNGINAHEFVCDSVSGGLKTDNLATQKATFKIVSGGVSLRGTFDMIKGNSVSGGVEIVSSVCPSRIWVENISGSNSVTIPENAGFTAQIERVSGRVKTDFNLLDQGKCMVYGDGSALFKLKNVSGSTSINRLR